MGAQGRKPKENNQMTRIQTTISVRHVSISIEKTFSETCSRFESRMGRIDYAAFEKMLREGESETAMENYVKGIEGPLGLMIFNAIDHGLLLRLAGKTALAKQYVVGNPLIALQMTQKDVRAGLYAPLRIYIREDGPNKSVIEYDLPSTLFGRFQNAEIDRVAMTLDQKLEAAIDYVLA
jgi:uncharacterized protein (DUF302 family)